MALMASRLALGWERAWQAFWPVLAMAGGVLAVLLSGVLPLLPGWLHLTVLLVLAAALLAVALRASRAWRWPSRAEALARLEGGGPGAHRPLTASADRLALGAQDPVSRALWRRHQALMAARARTLRVRPPRPRLAARDPRALRLVPLLLLFAALAAAWPDPVGRLGAALSPRLGAPVPPAVAQVWITPPAYTGQAPVYLEAHAGESPGAGAPAPAGGAGVPTIGPPALTVPAGGTVLALVRGGRGPAMLDLGAADDPRPLESAGSGGQRLEREVATGSRLRLTQGGAVLVDRPLRVSPDAPPSVAWTDDPSGDSRGRLTLSYRADDDHGVIDLAVTVRAAGEQVLGAPVDLALPPGATPGRTAVRDLSAHPWAGTPVTLALEATDARGQTGRSAAVALTLPERRFQHPVAQAVVDMRRALVMRPERAEAAAVGLSVLAEDRPAYGDSLAVFLSLKAAAARLVRAPDGRARTEDLALLWSIALALEDGTLTLARRELEQARQALREAVEDGADRAELARRLEAVREAMNRLMRDLAEALPLVNLPDLRLPMPEGTEMFSPEDVERMLDRLGDLDNLGAEEAARALLDQLDRMLQQLESARPPTAAEMRAMAEAAEMMQRLRDLAQRQRGLLDETFRQDRRGADRFGQPPAPPRPPGAPQPPQALPMPGAPGDSMQQWFDRQPPLSNQTPPAPSERLRDLEERQRALREALEDLMADLGDRTGQVPDQLGAADLAMREAEQALAQGEAGAAARAQGRALEALTQGQQQAMGQMMGPGGQPGPGGFGLLPMAPGQGLGPGGRPGLPGMMPRPGLGRDPFNRPAAGAADDDSVEVPSEPDTRRAHDILRELRRRANEADRPALERDYLDRLMDRF
ncbi:uncharacterized protein (TIGR02302 family) [Roseospira goensis]|uniref:Uncharacterized protein (TIGR02302 family) n=2 Tax=Roseospira goensis TaxID=391922 RepID=A0A7W6RYX0_9PROT|nr:uncharacterized protein (TIGR02302 family) [Roseospira goensis]